MRRVLAILAVLVVTMSSTIVIRRAGTPAPPSSFDLLDDETFDSSGYDLAGWGETTDGSPTVDEDETTLCPADTGFSGQCLETSSTAPASAEKYYAYYPLAATQGGPVYCRVYLNIVSASGLDAGENTFIGGNSVASDNFSLSSSQMLLDLANESGTLKLRGWCGGTFGSTTVTTGTTYLVEWYSNRAASPDECGMKINGTLITTTTSMSGDVNFINIGNGSSVVQDSDLVWDNIACDTTGWIGGL